GMFHHQRGLGYDDPFCIELALFEDLGICGGHGCGGILTDVNAATSVPGLYAAGDVDGGLPHSYLGGAFVMGGVAGEEAARYVAEVPHAQIDSLKPLVRKFIDDFEAPLRRERGIPVHLVEKKARTRIMYYMRPPQSPGMLRTGAWWMDRIRNEDIPQIKADDYHNLLKCHEVQSILLMGEIMSKASLYRDESRWGAHHWRLDMPAKKTGWERTWAVVTCKDGVMEFSKRKVPDYIIDCPDSLPYKYPEMKFDLGNLFKLDDNCRNVAHDQWMIDHIKKEGMETARRFMIDPKEGE
ncbi:MAG: fumarate reductase/succinate dehydrogenase flavoprotein subunit, partial [Armatimonadia bacterium]